MTWHCGIWFAFLSFSWQQIKIWNDTKLYKQIKASIIKCFSDVEKISFKTTNASKGKWKRHPFLKQIHLPLEGESEDKYGVSKKKMTKFKNKTKN